MEAFWNEKYASEGYVYGQLPNTFFADQLKTLSPGKLLLPLEGEGRNAVHAARLGWEVTAFDFSTQGRDKALKLANQHGVNIDYAIAEAASFSTKAATFDVIALIYAHFSPPERKLMHQRVVEWLKPGGTLLLEAFHTSQLGRSSGGPKNMAMLYDNDMLQEDFSSLVNIAASTKEVVLREGPGHNGEAIVVRFTGQKPIS